MKSYSTRPCGGRAQAILLAAALLGGGAGCQRVETDQATAEFVRSSDDPPCTDDATNNPWTSRAPTTPQAPGTPHMMDTYVVQILEINNINVMYKDGSDCPRCVATGENCHVEDQDCYCGGPAPPSPTELSAIMSGFHVGELDYGHIYCLQVLAVDRSSVTPAPAAECACDPSWTTPTFLTNYARLCALSDPYASPLPVSLAVQCRSDRTFAQCLGVGM
jgi:hypothetical protein